MNIIKKYVKKPFTKCKKKSDEKNSGFEATLK